MRKLVIGLIFLVSSAALHAQILTPVSSKEWDQIAIMYYKENGKGKMAPVYPPSLLALHNKIVTLPGYMIPIKVGIQHSTFMFSVLPLAQCSFCGVGGIPNMIEVYANKPMSYTEEQIKIKGKLVLNIAEEFGKCEVTVLNAELVK
jgi:hypothetical protein